MKTARDQCRNEYVTEIKNGTANLEIKYMKCILDETFINSSNRCEDEPFPSMHSCREVRS